jgi:hypothetical protein
MSFDAEAFFGGRKSRKASSGGIPDLDDFIRNSGGGYDMGSGFLERVASSQRRRGSYDDLNNNGFVDDLDFAHPPRASGKRTRQARLLGTDENNVAFGMQKFGNAIGRSEADIGRVGTTMRTKKKKRLKAAVELAERNPKKYNLQQAYERLENFEEKDLRRKAGTKSTRPYLTSDSSLAGERISKAGSKIKNEIGYRVSKSKLAKKIKQLEQARRTEKLLQDPEEKRKYQERISSMQNPPKVFHKVTEYNDDDEEEIVTLRKKYRKKDLSDDDREKLR